MKIIFGLELDDLVIPQPNGVEGGVHYFGPKGLLNMLESHLGLTGHPTDNDYLRIGQYRQAILKHLENHESPFYKNSFIADQFATATELLSRRDELLLAGWFRPSEYFEIDGHFPPRLKVLADIERVFISPDPDGETLLLSPGFADRFVAVLDKLSLRKHPFSEIILNEPFELLPFHFQKLFEKLNVEINRIAVKENLKKDNDLSAFKKRLLAPSGKKEKAGLKNDGSLLLLCAKRASDAAAFLAKLFKHNPVFRPACLIPEMNRALDIALIREGLPSLGIQSASLARPTLQILKLVTAFLWEPIDPFKILEFVSLSIKPLADDLATVIANQMAKTPGLNGEKWRATIGRYFDELADRAPTDSNLDPGEIRRQYEFWFGRRRYDMNKTVPKGEVIEIFDYLRNWAFQKFDENGGKNHSLLVLREQSRRVVELLETLPETHLTFLELERIVRTIYEPSPVVFQDCEVGHLPHVLHPSAIVGEITEVIWWNFVQNEPVHFFSRWYREERTFLQKSGIELENPERENARLIWQRRRPVLNATERLLIVMPERVDGSEVHPHPLFGDLEAAFENLNAITFDIDSEKGKANFEKHFRLPGKVVIPHRRLGHPKPFIEIADLDKLARREYESLTSLEILFYYPYQWVFKYKIRLQKSSILSVVKDNTLMGTLAHRLFEKLFRQDISNWDKPRVRQWMDREAARLFAREGAVLLMYGREPERVAFLNHLKYAAWSLVSQIQQNNWKVKQTEMDLAGKFMDTPVKGIADLVLEKENELAVIDLKWRGASRRERIIRNEEDLQLVLYSRLLSEESSWTHTAYFIMENGKMLARNNQAFRDITAVAPDADHVEINKRILARMEATYQWRMTQIEKGKIEIRTEHTCPDLEDIYYEESADSMMDLLEMKDGDAPFDDYRTLINLIE